MFGVYCQRRLSTPRVRKTAVCIRFGENRTRMARPCHFPSLAHPVLFLLHSPTAACNAPPSLARCNDIQIGRVICQVHFALGLTALCQPGREKKKSITRRPVFTEQFHPACTRGGLSSQSCLAFKCGKSAQSPPLTRNAARLSSWCSLNKLNNEGISEMPERHYTPTIRARSE